MSISKTTPISGISTSPIIFFGTEEYSLLVLRPLVEAGYPIAAVVTKPDMKRGRGQKLSEPTVKTFAIQHSIDVWQPKKLSEIVPKIHELNHPAAVLVAFGRIIPASILELFSPGIINVHPSLLPLYRGPSPVETAIANRDAKTGISIMKLTAAMDAGPVYIQAPYVLDQSETKPELYHTLFTLGANIIVKELPGILSGTTTPVEQDNSAASYCSLLTKEDGKLDPTLLTPGEAEARIRAHLGFPRSRVTLGKHEVIVTKAHGVMNRKTPLDLRCANGAYLSIDELVAPSGKTISATAFLRGYEI